MHTCTSGGQRWHVNGQRWRGMCSAGSPWLRVARHVPVGMAGQPPAYAILIAWYGTPRHPQASPPRFKSVYSNGVAAAAQARLAAWLRNRHGFRLADSKTTASLHVVDPQLNVQYSIAIGLTEGPTCVRVTDGTNCHHGQCLLPYGTCIGFKLG